jgi:uridylate kinase
MTQIKRAILKISGEIFKDENENISFKKYDAVAKQLIEIFQQSGAQLAIVVGGGNILRGRQADSDVDSNEADSMGMLATIINGVGLREAFARNGVDARLMTSIDVHQLAEPYIRPKGRSHLDRNRIVIIAGGLGITNFSTDSAVAQYAKELKCEIIFKASTTDGVYDSDPHKNPDAKKYPALSFQQAMIQNLAVMDKTAFAMCEKFQIPIFIFDIKSLDQLPQMINGDFSIGTLIS